MKFALSLIALILLALIVPFFLPTVVVAAAFDESRAFSDRRPLLSR